MLIQTFLSRLVVVRYNEQTGVGTQFLGFGGQFNGFARTVTAGPGDNRNPAINPFYDMTDNPAVFFRVKRCGFAGGAHGHNAMGAIFNMKVHQFVQILPVNVTVWMHGRDQCDEATRYQAITLADLKGKNVVIYFYPKDNTPGCTSEGEDFRDRMEQFSALDTEIFGVSRDSLKAHENFRAKYQFPFHLISDKDES